MARLILACMHGTSLLGYRELLKLESSITEIAEVACKSELLASLQLKTWDLVVLDMSCPRFEGVELLQRLSYAYPDLRVLVLSTASGEMLLKRGAFGCLPKTSAGIEVLAAVRSTVSGQRYFKKAILPPAPAASSHSTATLHGALSARELQVFKFIGVGKTLTRIGRRLHISVKTVGTYRARILEKMQLQTNADIVRYLILHQV